MSVKRLKLRQTAAGFFILTLLVVPVWAGQGDALRRIESVAPGLRHIYHYIPEGPWAIHVLEMDLRRKDLTVRTVKAGGKLAAREKTSDMVRQLRAAGVSALAAINGDFFAPDGTPVNMQIENGEILLAPHKPAILAFDIAGRPHIEYFTLEAAAYKRPDYRKLPIDGINTARQTDQIIFYNRFRGTTTATNAWGFEALLRPLDPFFVNDSVRAVVDSLRIGGPPFNLTGRRYVLSGHERGMRLLQATLAVGDTVVLYFHLQPEIGRVAQALGGLPWLLRQGQVFVNWEVEGARPGFAQERHPRTAVGFSANHDTLFLVTVDGRQEGYSVGMTLYELAKYMLSLGCSEAINLDGGGSTTMVIGEKVVNRPSDSTGERPVANALVVVRR